MAGKQSGSIGLYFGSFNPVHIGHLALANWLCEFGGMSEVWFLVSPHSPMKERADLLSDKLRCRLVGQAIASYDRFRLSTIELRLPQPSYTIQTLRELEKQYPGRSFYLIIGADNWRDFFMWKNCQEILSKYQILIYPRKGFPIDIPAEYSHVRSVKTPLIDISSTFIREAIVQGKDIRFFLPANIHVHIPLIREELLSKSSPDSGFAGLSV